MGTFATKFKGCWNHAACKAGKGISYVLGLVLTLVPPALGVALMLGVMALVYLALTPLQDRLTHLAFVEICALAGLVVILPTALFAAAIYDSSFGKRLHMAVAALCGDWNHVLQIAETASNAKEKAAQ